MVTCTRDSAQAMPSAGTFFGLPHFPSMFLCCTGAFTLSYILRLFLFFISRQDLAKLPKLDSDLAIILPQPPRVLDFTSISHYAQLRSSISDTDVAGQGRRL